MITSLFALICVLFMNQSELSNSSLLGLSEETRVPASENPPPSQPGSKPSEDINAETNRWKGPLGVEFKAASTMKLGERIKMWSAYLENDPKHVRELARLANGIVIEDVAPLVPDHFDCTTYVETVAALAQSTYPDDFIGRLKAIRYRDGKSDFYSRNHFADLDWIPWSQKAGILKDITHEIAKAHGLTLLTSRKEINRNRWIVERAKKEHLPRSKMKDLGNPDQIAIEAQVPYIKLSELKNVIDSIPDGAILNFVHYPDRKHATIITHQAILVRDGGKFYLRHALIGGKFRYSEVFSYFKNLASRTTRWPVIGINIVQLSDSSSSTNRFNETM